MLHETDLTKQRALMREFEPIALTAEPAGSGAGR
jgi:hypothetical protein